MYRGGCVRVGLDDRLVLCVLHRDRSVEITRINAVTVVTPIRVSATAIETTPPPPPTDEKQRKGDDRGDTKECGEHSPDYDPCI